MYHFYFFIFLFSIFCNLYGENLLKLQASKNQKNNFWSNSFSSPFQDGTHRKSFAWDYIHQLYGRNSLENIFENYYDYGLSGQHVSGVFTSPDREVINLNGNSYRWTEYYEDNYELGDYFFSGSSLYKTLLNEQSVFFDLIRSKIKFSNNFSQERWVQLSGGGGRLGKDNVQAGVDFVNLLGEPSHAVERIDERTGSRPDPLLIGHRRRNIYHLELKQMFPISLNKGMLYLRNLAQQGGRIFNTWDEIGLSGSNREDYTRLQLFVDYLPTDEKECGWKIRYEHLNRNELFAEQYYNFNETASLSQNNLSAWTSHSKGFSKVDWQFTAGTTIAHKFIRHNNKDFSRNLIDQDGAGFTPWYVTGYYTEWRQQLHNTLDFLVPWVNSFKLTLRLDNRLLFFDPREENQFHSLYYQNSETNLSAYVRFTSNQASAWNHLQFKIGVRSEKKILPKALHLKLFVNAIVHNLFMRDQAYFLSVLEGGGDLKIFNYRFLNLELHFGHHALPLTENMAFFLNRDYQNGMIHYWNDNNNDMKWNQGEDNGAYRRTGGWAHQAVDNLKNPSYIYFDMPLELHIGPNLTFHLGLSYKSYQNLLRLRRIDKNGNIITIGTNASGTAWQGGSDNQYDLYLLRDPDVIYELYNHDENFGPGESFLIQRPFYGSANFKLITRGKFWYSSFNFRAYIVAGFAGFGNGWHDNQMGSLQEEKADPNANIKSVGRSDNDRGYLGKINFSLRPVKGFWISSDLKYRDGKPFSHYLSYLHNKGQGNTEVILWQRSVNGDTEMFQEEIKREFGTRNDAVINWDLHLVYLHELKKTKFRLHCSFYNLVDLGMELNEKSFAYGRQAAELQTPPSLDIGFSLFF